MIAATQSNHPVGMVTDRDASQTSLKDACNLIRSAGMRVTKPRIALIEALLGLPGPVSIERIHQVMGPNSCDLVTIYRCLAAFENLGIVRRSYLHNGTCLYEQTISSTRRYHIICKECGHTDPVEYTMSGGVERMLQDRGYAQISHIVEFFGLCPTCQQSTKLANRNNRLNVVQADGGRQAPVRPRVSHERVD